MQLEDVSAIKPVAPLQTLFGCDSQEKDIYSKLGDVKDIKGFLVQCTNKDCQMWRDLPLKYLYNYDKNGWKHNFKCAKLKLRKLVCKQEYTFKPEKYELPPPDHQLIEETQNFKINAKRSNSRRSKGNKNISGSRKRSLKPKRSRALTQDGTKAQEL